MPRDPRYDLLFEPIKIGPKTASQSLLPSPPLQRSRLPACECNGNHAGHQGEGGWGVVNTEQCEIHPSSDSSPLVEMRIWDDRDLPALELMASKVQEHGSLAGIELTYNAYSMASLYTREVALAPSHLPVQTANRDPVQCRAMDKNDIRNFRRWHRNAVKRAKRAGSISSMSTPPTIFRSCFIFCPSVGIIAQTNMGGRWKIECVFCAKYSKTLSKRPTVTMPSACVSVLTSSLATRLGDQRSARCHRFASRAAGPVGSHLVGLVQLLPNVTLLSGGRSGTIRGGCQRTHH